MFDQRGDATATGVPPPDILVGEVPPGQAPVDVSAAGLAAALAADTVDRTGRVPVPIGPVPASARGVDGVRRALALMDTAGDQAEAVDRIRALEQLKAACAAAQARETVALETLRHQDEAARGVPAEARGRGLAGEVGLARRESPHRGSRHLSLARTLVADLPATLNALSGGTISEAKAAAIHRETSWLEPRHRRTVDGIMADRLGVLGERQLGRETRRQAQGQDPEAAAEHFDRAVAARRVTVRGTEDGMAYLTAVLPLPQAAACHAALTGTAATLIATGQAEGRSPQQVLADTLVERLTGQSQAGDVPVEVQLVLTDTTLLGADQDGDGDGVGGDGAATPGQLPGHGPIPAAVARRLVADTDATVFLRRLYTHPDTGQLVAMDSTRRAFPAALRRMVITRDELCRTPYCDAAIRHIDHAAAHRDGGPTSWDNASGLCTRCNHTKENPGWRHHATADHLTVTTPTGHAYHHPTPPLVQPPAEAPAAPDERQQADGSTNRVTPTVRLGPVDALFIDDRARYRSCAA